MSVQPLRPPTVHCDYHNPWPDGRPDPCIASVAVPTYAFDDEAAREFAALDGWTHVDGKDYCPAHTPDPGA